MNVELQSESGAKRRMTRVEAAAVGLTVFCAALISAARTPLTWDEGDAFLRAESVSTWFYALAVGPERLVGSTDALAFDCASEAYKARLRDYFAKLGSRRALFSEDALRVGFPHTVCREGHPTGYSLALAAGRAATAPFRAVLSEKQGFRFVGVLLFGLAAGAAYYRVARSFGRFAALVAAVSFATCPRVFAHAQIAGGDSLLISSWVLAWVVFTGSRHTKTGAVLLGCAFAISFGAKFSGFLIVAPLALVLACEFAAELAGLRRRDVSKRRRAALFLLACASGFALFLATNPTLWNRPITGLATFWRLNTEREGFNIPIYFFGSLYSPSRPAPWWNGYFWLAATIPLGTLVLACCAVFSSGLRAVRARFAIEDPQRARTVLSLVFMGLTFPTVRCVPGLPVHDGARLLIASAPFWCVLAGIGAQAFYGGASRLTGGRLSGRAAALILVCAAPIASAVDLVRVAPQYLSFYNALTGGVTGAVALGLEPTYYWDAFDEGVASALRTEMALAKQEGRPSGALFGAFSSQTLDYYRRWKTLGEGADFDTASIPGVEKELDRFGFYVMQRRPSGYSRLDLAFLANAKPIIRKEIADPIPLPAPIAGRKPKAVLLEVYAMPAPANRDSDEKNSR